MGKGYRSGADRLVDSIYSFRLSFVFAFLYRVSRRQQASDGVASIKTRGELSGDDTFPPSPTSLPFRLSCQIVPSQQMIAK